MICGEMANYSKEVLEKKQLKKSRRTVLQKLRGRNLAVPKVMTIISRKKTRKLHNDKILEELQNFKFRLNEKFIQRHFKKGLKN
jgi:hypothetical protein